MIEKLTKKQIELMAKVRDEWINLALHGKIDKEEVEAGVKWIYYSSNLKEPEVVFIGGPTDFAKKLGISDSVGASVRDSVWASVRDRVGASVWDSVGASVRDSVRASVWDSVWDSVGASVRDSVRASVRASVWDSVSSMSNAYDSDFGAWAEFYKLIKVVKKNEKLDKYLGYLKGGAFYAMFFEKKAFIMCSPKIVEQDERKRLHSTKGAALVFQDGTEIYSLRGVKFEKEWWDKIVNDKMSPEEIFAIDNLEHRRIAYEFMDKSKMKSLKDFKVLNEVKDDGKGYPMKVISFSVKNVPEPLKYLNCFCPSTGREYYLGTDQDTCSEAKSRSFGLGADEIEFIGEW